MFHIENMNLGKPFKIFNSIMKKILPVKFYVYLRDSRYVDSELFKLFILF